MKNATSLWFSVIALLGVVAFIAVSHRSSPRATVDAYFQAIQEMNYNKAYALVYPRPSNELDKLNEDEQNLLRTYLMRSSMKILHVSTGKNRVVVTVQVLAPDTEWCINKARLNVAITDRNNMHVYRFASSY